jgi:hypothetical protein
LLKKVDYHFEKKQPCRFEVRDEDSATESEFLGQVVSTIGEIVGAKNNMLVLDLTDKNGKPIKSKIILRTE